MVVDSDSWQLVFGPRIRVSSPSCDAYCGRSNSAATFGDYNPYFILCLREKKYLVMLCVSWYVALHVDKQMLLQERAPKGPVTLKGWTPETLSDENETENIET